MALPDKPRDRKQTLLMIWAGADLTAPAKPARDREEGYLYYLSGVDTETALPALPCRDRREMYMAYKAGQIDTLPTLPARDSTEQYWEVICGRSETLPLIPRDSTQQILEVIAENSAAPTEDVTVIGVSPLVLEDAVLANLISLTQYGKVVQNGTPGPELPIDLVCNNGILRYGAIGKNLIDPCAANTVLGYYINKSDGAVKDSTANFMFAGYMPVVGGKTYVAYGRAKSNNDLSDYNRVAWYNSEKEWISGADYTQNRISVVTAPENAAYARFSCNPTGTTATAVTQEMVDGYNWTFAEGNAEITPFVPFVGGIYTNGNPEVISIGGKNLNGGTLENKGYTSTGGESSSTTFAGTLWQIPTKAGEKFTVSWGGFPDGVSGVFINTWKTDNTWNARQAISASTSLTYTVGDGIGKINFTLYKTGGITIGENAWLQVEYGTSATDYEPYRTPQTATAPNLFAVGDYADDADIISGAVTRKVGIAILDGTENVIASGVGWALPIADKLKSGVFIWCSHYPFSNVSMASAPDKCIKNFASQNIGFKDSAFTSKTDVTDYFAAQYAAGTPVIVIYPLAEETTDTVTPQTLPLAEGDNTLTVTANVDDIDLEVTYRKLVSE